MTDAADPEAIDIGSLFRHGRETILGRATVINQGTVTDTRNFSEEISHSRNADCKSGDGSTVTPIRHFSGKMSGSRNANGPSKCAEGTNGWFADQPQSGDVCYYCRARFEPGQMRYRIMNAIPLGWGPAVLCMDCFKVETDVSILGLGPNGQPASRHTMQCTGCAEQINTIRNPRHRQWNFCSNRCYQRMYRKRRRGRDSIVDWKARRTNYHCEACKKPLDTYGEPNKRKDAKFCSNKCRQWHYRRTRQV